MGFPTDLTSNHYGLMQASEAILRGTAQGVVSGQWTNPDTSPVLTGGAIIAWDADYGAAGGTPTRPSCTIMPAGDLEERFDNETMKVTYLTNLVFLFDYHGGDDGSISARSIALMANLRKRIRKSFRHWATDGTFVASGDQHYDTLCRGGRFFRTQTPDGFVSEFEFGLELLVREGWRP